MFIMRIRLIAASVLLTVLAGCASHPTPTPGVLAPDSAQPIVSESNNTLDATLWMQQSAEYEAVLLGSYTLARQQLDLALADPNWDAMPTGERKVPASGLSPAVIADADETLLDNSAFQARSIRAQNTDFNYAAWLSWVSERRARALPGALAFYRYAAEQGVSVYYVSNRDDPAERAATVDNLRALGFPVAEDGSNVMLRNDPRAPSRDKGERRTWISERHRVLLLLGDNLGDFVDGVATSPRARHTLVERYRPRWGRQWIMLPNPAYGSWESAILRECGERGKTDPNGCKRDALRLQ
ncbi:MAG: acid phosphatase [Lysobacterales bacterium CG_4_10_14_3_um_filter_64_11]|nr:MAG: acid phosphatase [Xanthomonadales bacterium CG_4_10_14_3_um_filter_64_11]